MPKFSDDPVIDYMVTEAIVSRAGQRAKEEKKQREKDEWKDAAHRPGFSPT